MRISEWKAQPKFQFFQAITPVLPERNARLLARLDPRMLRAVLHTGCGVEIECEGVQAYHALDLNYWTPKGDHSLRDGGLEFITLLGTRICHMVPALNNFMLVASKNRYKISDRTSIHVHINVLNLTLDQVQSLVILYAVFEQALFNYASAHRKHNIFCVPLESAILSRYNYDLKDLIQHAQKYGACNLGAVITHGTVEFRHMETVYSFEPVWNWVVLLGLLKHFATVTPLVQVKEIIMNLKRQSEYDLFLHQVFGYFGDFLRYDPVDLDRAVSDSKLLFFNKDN